MLNAAETACLADIQAFAIGTVADAAPLWAKEGIPPQAAHHAAALGLTGLEVATTDGGRGFSYALKARACAALAAADFGFAMSVVNTHNVAHKISLCATKRVKDAYLPALLDGRASACTALTEAGAGSDFRQSRCRQCKPITVGN